MTTKALVAVYYLDVGLDVMPRRSDPNKNSTIVAVLPTTVSAIVVGQDLSFGS